MVGTTIMWTRWLLEGWKCCDRLLRGTLEDSCTARGTTRLILDVGATTSRLTAYSRYGKPWRSDTGRSGPEPVGPGTSTNHTEASLPVQVGAEVGLRLHEADLPSSIGVDTSEDSAASCTLPPKMFRNRGKSAPKELSQVALADASAASKESAEFPAVIQTAAY